jgi:hypothetical protein
MKSSLHSLIPFLPFLVNHLRLPSQETHSILRQPESESESLYDWRFTANQLVLAPSHMRLTTSHFFQLNTSRHSPYVTSSLMRVWVCRLQLLLALASAVILGAESRGIHNHILLSHIRDFLNLEGQVPVFISARNRMAQLYPQVLGSLFFASYDSQGCGGGIWTPLHTGRVQQKHIS